jgi:methylenetetrahydrofolate dehydrogenase (NADP+) / methenyltetrahydrofolate cyclohydrolase
VSPVPGGVGPITDIWVLRNTVTAAWLQTAPPSRNGVTT